jgi:AbrB family looped-hinge helix DNA binding protein
MSKVTSKLQVTIPKAVAERYGIAPGDDIEFVPAGDAIHVVTAGGAVDKPDPARRLELFDQATRRQRARERHAAKSATARQPQSRGWTREELYSGGRAGRH